MPRGDRPTTLKAAWKDIDTLVDTVDALAEETKSKDREIARLQSALDSCERAAGTLGSQLSRARESSPEYDHRDVRARYD